jgi:hypothetical protein
MLCTRCQSIDFRSAPLLHDLEKPGHESDEARHQGPIELRCYRKNVNQGDGDGDGDGGDLLLPPAEHIVAVARTPHRDVKVVLDLVRYDCKF